MKQTFLLITCVMSLFKMNAQEVSYDWHNTELLTEERIESLINAMTLEEKVSQLKDVSPAIPRLDIVEYNWWNECLHGVARNGRATVFPQAIGLAATFDTKLIKEVSTAISDEARAKYNIAIENENRSRYAGLTFWTPNVNIFRDPRWGRGQETYGEDPYLTSQIGIAFVKGLQGDDPKYLKTAACAKHFAVHSGPEALRHEFDAIASPRDLQETYFPAFEALVKEANVEIVMGAYNRVLGAPACGSPFLLQETLRDKWGFTGHIVSDCGALSDFHLYHKVTKTPEESAALAINSGVDLNCGNIYPHLVAAVKQGLVKESTIDERLTSLLTTRFKLGMFDPLDDNPYNSISEDVICSEKHSKLALEAARKSIVMLSNKNNVLPLSKNIRNLFVTGPQANNSEVLLGNYYGMSNHLVNVLEGITAAVSAGTTINYKQGCLPFRTNVNPIDWTTGEAKGSDVIIAVVGINGNLEGEEGEAIASGDKGDRIKPFLPANQIAFLKKLRKDNEKPLIVVMTGGSPMIIPEVNELADAILWAWYPGQEGGTAVADIIFGDVSPSGRLPLTFLASTDNLPSYDDYSMKNRTYKYLKDEPLFPFGYGLSYSTFNFDNVALSSNQIKKGDDVSVFIDITNSGDKVAEEVAQVYLVQPGAGETAPLKKLVAFKRVRLKPGETKSVELNVLSKQMVQFTEKGKDQTPKGEYKLFVGNCSPSSRISKLNVMKPIELNFRIK